MTKLLTPDDVAARVRLMRAFIEPDENESSDQALRQYREVALMCLAGLDAMTRAARDGEQRAEIAAALSDIDQALGRAMTDLHRA